MNRNLGTYRGAASPAEVRVAIESADCLLCVGVRFTDTATGFFSHPLRSEALINIRNIRAFDVTVGTTHVPGVAGSEVLRALVKTVRIKPRRIAPPRLQPPTRLPSQFRQSLTQDRFWQRMQDFIQPGDVVLADIGTSSAGTAGSISGAPRSFIAQPAKGVRIWRDSAASIGGPMDSKSRSESSATRITLFR
jgi:indolepyruvate decarboxylase